MKHGYYGTFRAVKYEDGTVFYHVAGHWYRPIGGEHLFKPS